MTGLLRRLGLMSRIMLTSLWEHPLWDRPLLLFVTAFFLSGVLSLLAIYCPLDEQQKVVTVSQGEPIIEIEDASEKENVEVKL